MHFWETDDDKTSKRILFMATVAFLIHVTRLLSSDVLKSASTLRHLLGVSPITQATSNGVQSFSVNAVENIDVSNAYRQRNRHSRNRCFKYDYQQ